MIVAGLVYNPANDDLFTAERGKGAFLNDQRLRVAGRKRLADAVMTCGLPHLGRGDLALALAELAAVQDKVAGLRRFGAAALDLAWVAAGRFDGYWERNLSPWDVAAGDILVREAGGYVTDLDGGETPWDQRRRGGRQRAMHRSTRSPWLRRGRNSGRSSAAPAGRGKFYWRVAHSVRNARGDRYQLPGFLVRRRPRDQ
jgi:myo-inositol-1(or 4)-monophosphatase